MRTLARAVGGKDMGGEPLPSVFRTFDINKIVIRRSEVSMIAGTPGAGKSTLALAIALRAKVPVCIRRHKRPYNGYASAFYDYWQTPIRG
jgi:ABC-type nitrate/sulfonate/bicarbonate transport system ATPase subunit